MTEPAAAVAATERGAFDAPRPKNCIAIGIGYPSMPAQQGSREETVVTANSQAEKGATSNAVLTRKQLRHRLSNMTLTQIQHRVTQLQREWQEKNQK